MIEGNSCAVDESAEKSDVGSSEYYPYSSDYIPGNEERKGKDDETG